MPMTQGTFSFLPDLTEEQIRAQVKYCFDNGWAVNIEYTDDPHPRNTYWEMWDLPMFDLADPAGVITELNNCKKVFPNHYIRISAFDSTATWESLRISFIVNRPQEEPGYFLDRNETRGRTVQYTLRPYATQKPAGQRY
jgi:ribulose-bisphosphate carboxylase small chain